MRKISHVNLVNFRRFRSQKIVFNDQLNVLIGDNEAGKSSVLNAIDLVLSGSSYKVDSFGIDSLLNYESVKEFQDTQDKNFSKLPRLTVELYLKGDSDFHLSGKNNLEEREWDGLKMIIEPNEELSSEISECLSVENPVFPYEYYIIRFSTFSGEAYSGYKRYLKHLLIDNSLVGGDYVMREYTKSYYEANTDPKKRTVLESEYRKHKSDFQNKQLGDINQKLGNKSFAIKHSTKENLVSGLVVTEGEISIENKGKGKQCFIKTEFALSRATDKLDVVLMEEPENHQSHINMRRLVNLIDNNVDSQLFITTHSDMICARLDLQNLILMNSNEAEISTFKNISKDTAKFFTKAPDNNLLQFVLSKKVILVEGDAEYILMEHFFQKTTKKDIDDCNVHIISVDGTSFKRYLELSKLLNIKTAVIRDNDGDFQNNCVERYRDYVDENQVKVFYDTDNLRTTFEKCIYADNNTFCDNNITTSSEVLKFMLNNKAEAALRILEKYPKNFIIPAYLKKAIIWINE